MNILYVISAYGPRYVANEIHHELLMEFSRRGHRCMVYAGVTPRELGADPISFHDGPVFVHRQLCDTRGRHRLAAEAGRLALRYPRFLPLLWGLRRLLREHPEIDVIHADSVYPTAALAALAATGHRAVLVPTINGGDLIDYPGYGYGRFWQARQLIRWTFGRAEVVRSNSPLMADYARRLGCAADKLHHVPVNIGDRFFADQPALAARRAAARAVVARRHHLDPSAPLLLSVGRLLPLKGFHDAITALGRVSQTHPNVKLLIAGPNFVDERLGDQQAALARAIIEHGVAAQVELLPTLDNAADMPDYLAAADLCLAVAHIEGLNRVVAEAAALGTPAIVSSMTGISALVAECAAGLVVAPRDTDGIAAAIDRLLVSSAERVDLARGAQRLAQHFRTAVVADMLLALYQVGLETTQRETTNQ